MVTELLDINERLRQCLSNLELLLGVRFDPSEIERVFSDSIADQVREKRYCFFESPRIQVRGRVDDYEPETIWLSVSVTRRVWCWDKVDTRLEAQSHRILKECIDPYFFDLG